MQTKRKQRSSEYEWYGLLSRIFSERFQRKHPLKWKKPSLIFVNSMSELFHEKVPDTFIKQVFKTMNDAHWHTFQVLTKRPERISALDSELHWTPNIWMGTSVENEAVLDRVDLLRRTSANLKFLSCEPLLGPLPSLSLDGIGWVIVGGESGPYSRPMAVKWIEDILAICVRSNVPFFFKQWGGKNKKKAGRTLHGRTWDQYPSTINS